MNLDQVNKWLTLVANLGVLAGFVLLAMQLNQNTTAIRSQNAAEVTKVAAGAELAAIGDTGYVALTRAMLRPAEMSDEQVLHLWYYVDNVITSAVNLWIARASSGTDTSSRARLGSWTRWIAR